MLAKSKNISSGERLQKENVAQEKNKVGVDEGEEVKWSFKSMGADGLQPVRAASNHKVNKLELEFGDATC